MTFPKITEVLRIVGKVFSLAILSVSLLILLVFGYLFGYYRGYREGAIEAFGEQQKYASSKIPPTDAPQPSAAPRTTTGLPVVSWGGPDLWDAVNKRRQELGVNPLSQKDELCTIASIRLNEQLELGKLDGHEGFSNLPERRPDLKWIFDQYNISEFLLSGAQSADEAVALWENTLGHKKLLTGGEYVYGCTYAQNSFGVAIAAY